MGFGFMAHWYAMAVSHPYDVIWNLIGFGGQAVYPREAQALHPGRGVGLHAGVYIEGETDGENDTAPQPGLVALHPGLLLGGAEADPDEVRGQAVDLLDD